MTPDAINAALHRMGQTATQTPRVTLGLRACRNCAGQEHLEIDYSLSRAEWSVWCGCGNDTAGYPVLRYAINAWNRRNA